MRCFQSAAPVALWTCAADTAAYLVTRLPSKALDNAIPYVKWTGQPLHSLSHLRVWGCPVFWKIQTHVSKLKSRCREGIFVGYSTGTQCYRVYDPVTKRLSESRNCTFDEKFTTKRAVRAPILESLSDFDYPIRVRFSDASSGSSSGSTSGASGGFYFL